MTVLSLGDEVATRLQTVVAGLNFNGAGTINLYSSLLPDSPDQAVAVLERPGQAPILVLTGQGGPENKIDQPAFQVRVRSAPGDYVAGNTLMQNCFAALQGITEQTITAGGQWFHLIAALSSPAYLGLDVKQRHEWSLAFRVIYDNGAR